MEGKGNGRTLPIIRDLAIQPSRAGSGGGIAANRRRSRVLKQADRLTERKKGRIFREIVSVCGDIPSFGKETIVGEIAVGSRFFGNNRVGDGEDFVFHRLKG